MFKIGDFSRIGQVSVRMLRHYDKLRLLTPSHTDQFTGYRYYTIEQLARLHRIVALNDLGLTLQQIAGMLSADDRLPAEKLRGMLASRQLELAQEILEKQAQLASVAARLHQIEREGRPASYELLIKPLEPLTIVSVRQIVATGIQMNTSCATMFAELYALIDRARIAHPAQELTIYHNQEYTEVDIDVETAVVLEATTLPASLPHRTLHGAPLAAALLYEGMYAGVGSAVLTLLGAVAERGCVPDGPLRELHHSGPAHLGGRLIEPAVLELQIPIKTAA